MSQEVKRRDFIRGSASIAAGVGIGLVGATAEAAAKKGKKAPAVQAASGPGTASNRILMGLVGCGGRGTNVLDDFMENPEIQVVSLCDPDSNRANEKAAEIEKKTGKRPEVFADYRKLLENKDLNVLQVATPDHWHCLPVVHACELGLDVYVEKPLAQSIAEGRAMVNAARKYDRIVQMGTQQRSAKHFQEAVEVVRSGVLGQITYCRTWNWDYDMPNGVGKGNEKLPDGVDYDLWLGPAPKTPFNSNRFHYQWRWFYDYAGGMLCDWGVHLIDIVQWAMDAEAPEWVTASGGKYAIPDNRDTPDTLEVTYQYPATKERPAFTMVYSNTKACAAGTRQPGYGIEFYGVNGSLFVDRSRYQIYPQYVGEKDNKKPLMEKKRVEGETPTLPHVRNFLDCVKSREKPISEVEIGHRTASTTMMGNIAYLTGERLHWDMEREKFTNGSSKANAMRGREYRKPWNREARHFPLPFGLKRLLT